MKHFLYGLFFALMVLFAQDYLTMREAVQSHGAFLQKLQSFFNQ